MKHKKKPSNIIQESSTKIIYASDIEDCLIQRLKDSEKILNNQEETIKGTGSFNNIMSAFLMQKLENIGIKTYFIKKINMQEQLIKKLDIMPLEIIVRNIASKEFAQNLNIKENTKFINTIIEFYYKNKQKLHYINEESICTLDLLNSWEIEEIKRLSLKINDFLCGFFAAANIKLYHVCLIFGRSHNLEEYEIILANEITLDSCMLSTESQKSSAAQVIQKILHIIK